MDNSDVVQELRERLIKIETLLEDRAKSDDLRNENLEEKIRVSNHRIADLEDTIRWLWRTLIGALAVGAIELLFTFVK